jgi:hypothetical protein
MYLYWIINVALRAQYAVLEVFAIGKYVLLILPVLLCWMKNYSNFLPQFGNLKMLF